MISGLTYSCPICGNRHRDGEHCPRTTYAAIDRANIMALYRDDLETETPAPSLAARLNDGWELLEREE